MRVKVCGMTQLQQVDQLEDLGATFAGFIFYPRSPRYVLRYLTTNELKKEKKKMAFEWKTIGGESPSVNNPQPVVQPQAQNPIQEGQSVVSSIQPSADLPVCNLHNVAVNSTEKSGYNATYDAEAYNSYDTGVNSDENAVVS